MATQKELILEYYVDNPDRAIPHAEVVDWATTEWNNRTGMVFRDPDRAIRTLYSENKLIKIQNGLYQYNPDWEAELADDIPFTTAQRAEILAAGGYRCSVCGVTAEEGGDLQVDHIKPRSRGGTSTVENGQVLCSVHNYRKSAYSQTETGKRMFINLRNLAEAENDSELIAFIDHVLRVYDKHNINSHIEWKS